MDKQKGYGIQECSKCEYKLRCEECVYNEKDISELIKFEKQQARKETAEKILNKIQEVLYNAEECLDEESGQIGYEETCIDNVIKELAKQFGVEIKE